MCIHTVQYSVQPSKGKYTRRVYYARIVHNPQKKYILYVYSIAYIYNIHAYPSLAPPPPTPPPTPPPPGGENKIRYELSVL